MASTPETTTTTTTTAKLDLASFNPVAQRLPAVRGIVSDHVPISFTITCGRHTFRVLSWNISATSTHGHYADADNAYVNTDLNPGLVDAPTMKNKMREQLLHLNNLLGNLSGYDFILVQEADWQSLSELQQMADQIEMDVFSLLNTRDGEPYANKPWLIQAILQPYNSRYHVCHAELLTGSYPDPVSGRQRRTNVPLLDVRRRDCPDTTVLRLASAHIPGNAEQNPSVGISHDVALVMSQRPGVPTVFAGDFNTVHANVVAALSGALPECQVALPLYPTHMCTTSVSGQPPQFNVVAYDHVVYRDCTVHMDRRPESSLHSGLILQRALMAALSPDI